MSNFPRESATAHVKNYTQNSRVGNSADGCSTGTRDRGSRLSPTAAPPPHSTAHMGDFSDVTGPGPCGTAASHSSHATSEAPGTPAACSLSCPPRQNRVTPMEIAGGYAVSARRPPPKMSQSDVPASRAGRLRLGAVLPIVIGGS